MKYKCPRYDEKFCGTGCPHGGEHDRRDNCHKQCDRRAFHGETGIVCVAVEDDPDAAVVSRFNELWKSQKVECCAHSDCHLDWFYCLRPTPRYRPFTAVEAAGHLGKKVTIKRSDSCYIEWRISAAGLMFENNGAYTWQEAVDQIIFTDTGEPFGVREE